MSEHAILPTYFVPGPSTHPDFKILTTYAKRAFVLGSEETTWQRSLATRVATACTYRISRAGLGQLARWRQVIFTYDSASSRLLGKVGVRGACGAVSLYASLPYPRRHHYCTPQSQSLLWICLALLPRKSVPDRAQIRRAVCG